MKHWRRAPSLLLVCVGLLLPAAAQTQARSLQPVEVDRIVAVINDEVITLKELLSRLVQAERQLKKQGTPLPPSDVLQRQLLERMIADKVQLQLAREGSVRVDDTQLELALSRVAETNKMNVSEFRAALERDGIDWNRFREEVRNEMIIGRLREREVDNRIVVSEGEVDNYLANPARSAGLGEEFLIQHILLRVPEQASPEQLQRLRSRAEQALSQLQQGSDFAKTAAEFSDAPDALEGGMLGWRSADRLPSLFAESAATMKPGELSGVLRSAAGFHIIKLGDRRGGSVSGKPVQQTRVRHILLKTSELVSDAEAERKLTGLKERLDHGAAFDELARLHSNDLSANKGGDLGWIYPGDTVPEFERTMDALAINGISVPIRSPFGWHLIQVLERRVEDVTKDRERQLARAALRERKSDEAYEDWLRQLRDRAYVEYRLEEK